MIKAETGMPNPLKEIEQQCDQMVDAWKTVTFPTAWKYLVSCQQSVYDPGYVENPWGFRKTFHVHPGTVRRDFEREAGNFPKHWSGEEKQGEFRESPTTGVILSQALQECSEGATTRAESRPDDNDSTSALIAYAIRYSLNCPYKVENGKGQKLRIKSLGDNRMIQSTVAQTVNIAADLIRRYRRDHNMKFRIQNQIHDAIMLELPFEEKEECKKMFQATMAAVKIPLGNGKFFQLGCDIDCYDRWGVKSKEQ